MFIWNIANTALQFIVRMESYFLCGRDFLVPIIKIPENVGANPCIRPIVGADPRVCPIVGAYCNTPLLQCLCITNVVLQVIVRMEALRWHHEVEAKPMTESLHSKINSIYSSLLNIYFRNR
jgi:hypothetical protein